MVTRSYASTPHSQSSAHRRAAVFIDIGERLEGKPAVDAELIP
jgi:hypothetical protein